MLWKVLVGLIVALGIAALALVVPGVLLVVVPLLGGLVALIWGDTPSKPTIFYR